MKSFIKWAGGKYQLLNEINSVIDSMRDPYDRFIYVEPFVGGGAVLFSVLERCSNLKYAVINDMNENLMKCYRVISDDTGYINLCRRLVDLENTYNDCADKKGFHSEMKALYNTGCRNGTVGDIECASIFIFLNKTSFNGIYRENGKGEFNVPWNQRDRVSLFDDEEIRKIHYALKEKVIVLNGDYTGTRFSMDLARVEKCGLIYYFDPPYRPIEGTNSFVGYTKGGFTDKDQERLKSYCDEIDENGYDFVVSNSKSGNYFENLYKGYIVETVKARRNINSDGDGRGKVDELLIYNREKKNIGLF